MSRLRQPSEALTALLLALATTATTAFSPPPHPDARSRPLPSRRNRLPSRSGSGGRRTALPASSASYVGALDQGTSSTRFLLLDDRGRPISSSQKEHAQFHPRPGWVEHDPEEIWTNSLSVVASAMERADLNPEDVKSIGVTNQRETTVVWDRRTGRPLHNAIVWNCGRTSEIASEMRRRLGGRDALLGNTGLPLSTYFSATKLVWLFENVAGLKEKCEKGDALFGTIDCWLTWKLTGGEVHATDVTNAARTLLADIQTLQWDDYLLDLFDVPRQTLPDIEPSIGGDFGTVDGNVCPSLSGVPIGAVLGDQHAATFGQCCFDEGDAKATFGTGAFLMMNTGPLPDPSAKPKASSHGLLTTPLYQRKDDPPVYALEGAVAVAGSLVQWLRDNLRIGDNAKDIANLAATVNDAEGLRFVPAFNGLFAPHWRDDARGLIAGITAFHTRAHVARAALDAAAFQTAEVFDAMALDSGVPLTELRVDGGMAANSQFLQFVADVLDATVLRPEELETTAIGAATAAGLSAGVWSSLDELKSLRNEDTRFVPEMTEEERRALRASWDKAVDRSMGWVDRSST